MGAVNHRDVQDWPELNDVLRQLVQHLNFAQGYNVRVPTSSSSDGDPGMLVSDGKYVYYCWTKNSWLRFTGSTF